MDELEKIDDSVYHNPQTGEGYFSVEYTWYPSDQAHKQHIIRELEDTIEALVFIRSGAECGACTLSVADYFDRIKAYKPSIIREDGSYTEFCNAIADEVLPNWELYKPDMGTFLTDIDKVRAIYAQPITEAAEELIEYRALQKVRSQLNTGDLTKHLHKIFMVKVLNSAKVDSRSTIEDLMAELSLCLTDVEREEQLKTEYRDRLEAYKEKAKLSELAHAGLNFTWIPWQCFTTDYLDKACYDLIQGYTSYTASNSIQFDLTLINWWLIYRYAELDLQQNTGQIFKQHVEVAYYNSRKGKDSITMNAVVDDCTKFQYIQRPPV